MNQDDTTTAKAADTSAVEDEYGLMNQSLGNTELEDAVATKPPKGKAPMDAPIIVESVKKDDLQPSYAYNLETPRNGWYGNMMNGLGDMFGTLGALPVCCCCPNPFKSVDQGQVGLVTRFGQFYKSVDPGLVRVNPLSEKLYQVEVRIQVLDIPHQMCMTKDNVNIKLSSVLYYHIVSPHKARFGITNMYQALQERTQTTLRHVVGARSLQEIIERREELARSIEEIINDTAMSWGVRVESILIKDVLLSDELQDSLSQAAKARRTGESKIIIARSEVESAKLIRKAADILASKPAMQMRYLDALTNMAKTSNSKVIFMPSAAGLEQTVQQAAMQPGFQGAAESAATDTNEASTSTAHDNPEIQQSVLKNAAYQEMNV